MTSETLHVADYVYPQATVVERVLDQIFPPLCVGCSRMGRWICERCWGQVSWVGVADPVAVPSGLDGLIAVAQYDGVAREAVHALKFEGRHAISGMMGLLMARAVLGTDFDLISPVPLHRSRRRERGYDQAAMLAQRIATRLEKPCRRTLLRRTRKTQQQALLDGIKRQENVRGAFAARERLGGETVLLVDDVLTTGATMSAAAGAARAAGAGRVLGCVFARA